MPVRTEMGQFAFNSHGRLVSAKHPFEPDTAAYTLDARGNVVDAEAVSPS